MPEPVRKRTAADIDPAVSPPHLCPSCRVQVLQWLRAYERALEKEAQERKTKRHYLALALVKHVAVHLRRLRRLLASAPDGSAGSASVEMQALYEGEVVEL